MTDLRRLTEQTLRGMKRRCHDPRHATYEQYGARGVRVYFDWHGRGGLASFIADVGLRPSRGHQIDRIDPEKGYEPGNVRWVPRAENLGRPSKEHRCCRGQLVLATGPDGKALKLTLYEWAELLGISYRSLSRRLQRAGSDAGRRLAVFSSRRRHR